MKVEYVSGLFQGEIKIKDRSLEVRADILGRETDRGIGHYECHGRVGFDRQPCVEPEDAIILSVTLADGTEIEGRKVERFKSLSAAITNTIIFDHEGEIEWSERDNDYDHE